MLVPLNQIFIIKINVSRGDRGWTLQNLHFTPYLSNEKKIHSILGLPLAHNVYYNLKHTKHENIN